MRVNWRVVSNVDDKYGGKSKNVRQNLRDTRSIGRVRAIQTAFTRRISRIHVRIAAAFLITHPMPERVVKINDFVLITHLLARETIKIKRK